MYWSRVDHSGSRKIMFDSLKRLVDCSGIAQALLEEKQGSWQGNDVMRKYFPLKEENVM